MIDVVLPEDQAVPELVRSFSACLASVLETPVGDIPQPRADLPGALPYWRSWLAGRGTGLVSIATPGRFAWPGYWLAVLGEADRPGDVPDQTAVLMFGTPAGVVLSPQRPDLVGAAATDLPVREGYVVSALDPRLATAPSPPLPHRRGTVELIALAEHATGPMRTVDRAHARAGRGLDGDRYAAKAGTFTPASDTVRGHDLTLVEAEALDDLTLPGGERLEHAEARRNIVTRGIDLNSLVGRRFRVGDVECLGQRLCEPCSHLEQLTTKGTLRGLIHRGGLRADVLTDGEIAVGAVVETLDTGGPGAVGPL